MTVNIFEAIRKATDPFGMEGERTAAVRPSAKEVLERLSAQGWIVMPKENLKLSFEVDVPDFAPKPRG